MGQVGVSAAKTHDPQDCATSYPAICPAGARTDAIVAFPYWDNVMYRVGQSAGISIAYGVYGDYLYAGTCEHCAVAEVYCFQNGVHQDECYSNPDYPTSYKQFSASDGEYKAAQTGYAGDRFVRLVADQGDPLPTDLTPLRVLPSHEAHDVPAGALMLGIGSGVISTSETLGVFEECATQSYRGNPGVGCDGNGENCTVNACCSPGARTVSGLEIYRCPLNDSRCESPSNLSVASCYPSQYTASYITAVGTGNDLWTCIGDEGNYATCTAAGLTFMGAAWESKTNLTYDGSNSPIRPQWATWEYVKFSPGALRVKPDPASVIRTVWDYTSTAFTQTTPFASIGNGFSPFTWNSSLIVNGENERSEGHCYQRVNSVTPSLSYDVTARIEWVYNHVDCWDTTEFSVDSTYWYAGGNTVSSGDSGGATFVYHDGEWWFIAQAQKSTDGALIIPTERSRLDSWTGRGNKGGVGVMR